MMMKKSLITPSFWSLLLLFLLSAINLQAQDNCISGTIYEDTNNNTVQDIDEMPIPNQVVRLGLGDGSEMTVNSGDDGFYEFCDLTTGTYTLNLVNLGVGSSSNPTNYSFNYLEGELLEPFNFGLLNLSDFGQLNVTVFYDQNNSNDATAQARIENRLLTLTGNGTERTTTTDAYGEATIENVPNGSYTLRIDPAPANTQWADGDIIDLEVVAGQIVNRTFRLQALDGFGEIQDNVCYDLDGDGQNDPLAEPGIYAQDAVSLFNEGGEEVATTHTDAFGGYGFSGIAPGNYTISFNFNPDDLLPTTPENYEISVSPNESHQPGPFYGQPLRKKFSCGMAVSTFGSIVSQSKVMSVKDIRDRSTAMPPSAGVVWTPPSFDHPSWTVGEMGEVFGIAVDEEQYIYITATSIPTYAGSFTINIDDPLIYKVDPYTLVSTPYLYAANTTTLGSSDIASSNTGLGNITYNVNNKVLYTTNMSDGTIVVIGGEQHPNPGQVLQVYPVTSFTPADVLNEDVWGIGFNATEDRLYFSSPSQGGSRNVYSISINTTNGLISGTEITEFNQSNNIAIADLAFSGDGQNILIAERLYNGPHSSRLFQRNGSSTSWGPTQQIYVGLIGSAGANSAGGVDYAYDSFSETAPPAGGCDTYITASGNLAFSPGFRVYGYQITPSSGNISPTGFYNTTSYTNLNSTLIDNDNQITSADKFYQGDVEVFDCECLDSDCADENGLEMLPALAINPNGVGDCCFLLDFNNNGQSDVYGISLTLLDGAEFQSGYALAAGMLTPNYTDSSMVIVPSVLGTMPNNINGLVDFCLHSVYATPQFLVIEYLDENYEVFCTDTLTFECAPEAPCLEYLTDSLVCAEQGYLYTIDFEVPPGSDIPGGIGYIELNLNPNTLPVGTTISPTGYTFNPKLQPGDQVSLTYLINTPVDLFGDSLCVAITAHDDEEERLCCFAYENCIPFPMCDPCPDVDASVRPVEDDQSEYCCFELFITDTHTLNPNLFTSIQTNIITPGVVFDGLATLPAIIDGWTPTYDNPLAPTAIDWNHNSGLVPNNTNYNLFDFCVEGTPSTDSIYMEINWLSQDSVVCTDTVAVFCPYCMTVVEDQLYCDNNGDYVYQFSFVNNSPFPVNAVSLLDAVGFPGSVNNPGVYMLGTTVPVGGTYSGFIPVQLNGLPGEDVCFDIVLRQIIGDAINITCCYATHCVELVDCGELPELPCTGEVMSQQECPDIFDPVCGCDGNTYANICYAQNAGITSWTAGHCDDSIFDDSGQIDLSAQTAQGGVQLNWSLSSPGNFDFFVIFERLEGETGFSQVALLPANGMDAYSFIRLTDTPGSRDYLVIGITNNGWIQASNEAIVFLPESLNFTAVYAYPSPARDVVQVTVNRTGPAKIELISPTGSIDQHQQAEFSGAPIPVSLDRLQDGVYLIRIRFEDGEVVQQRVVRVRE